MLSVCVGSLGRGGRKTSLGVFEVTLMDCVSGVLESLCHLMLPGGGVLRFLIDKGGVIRGMGGRGGYVGDT